MGRHHVHSATSPITAVKVAAAVTAGAALPAAFPADAMAEPPSAVAPAPGVNLGPIAACESGGNPRATNRQSTASGTYQMINGTWAASGGLRYGPRAKDATPEQQTEIALRLYSRSGLTPWAASRHCWGSHVHQIVSGPTRETPVPDLAEETREAPAPDSTPTPPVPPQPQQSVPAGIQLGARDADGRGWYRCSPADLRFDACDPNTIGELQQYPVYEGHRAEPLPPLGTVAGIKLEAFETPTAIPVDSSPAELARKSPAATPLGAAILASARTWLGVPYRWGGTTRSGVDCSALVQNVLRAHGISAPRTAAQQARWARRISRSQLRPGDLVFGVTRGGTVHHVGIYVGNGQMLDAPDRGRRVSIHRLYRDSVRFGRVPSA